MRLKGDILEATDRGYDAGKHYIVYWDGYDDNNFIGLQDLYFTNEGNFNCSWIPDIDQFISQNDDLNAYALDFYQHGQARLLKQENGIRCMD